MTTHQREAGSILVEMAGVLLFLCVVFFMTFSLIRLVIAKDMLDYATIQTSQCIKYGNSNVGYCVEQATSGFEFFIDSQKVSTDITYYNSLLLYKKTPSTRKTNSIAVVTLSYNFTPNISLIASTFPSSTNLTSTATVRIEK